MKSFVVYVAMSLIAAIAVLSLPSSARGDSFAGKTEMNGISYNDYAGFEDKWKMITVRYRTDTGEERWVWGNESAITALEAGGTEYPDGAVFAKIGYGTNEDPAFTNSRVPSGAKRYQFMLRDKKKYASTGGWGYALFDVNKQTYNGDPTLETAACYACHHLVPERAEVFSQTMKMSAFSLKLPDVPSVADALPDTSNDVVKFETISFDSMPEMLRKILPKTKTVRSISGELKKHVFRGTIDELRPRLMLEAKKTGQTSALIATDNEQFAVIYPDKNKACAGGKGLKSVFSTSVPSNSPGSAPYLVVAWQNLCP